MTETDLVSLCGLTEKTRHADVVRHHKRRLASTVLHHTVRPVLYQQVHYALCKHKTLNFNVFYVASVPSLWRNQNSGSFLQLHFWLPLLVFGLKIHPRVFGLGCFRPRARWLTKSEGLPKQALGLGQSAGPRSEANQGQIQGGGSYSNPRKNLSSIEPILSLEFAFLDTEVRSLPWPSLLMFWQPCCCCHAMLFGHAPGLWLHNQVTGGHLVGSPRSLVWSN